MLVCPGSGLGDHVCRWRDLCEACTQLHQNLFSLSRVDSILGSTGALPALNPHLVYKAPVPVEIIFQFIIQSHSTQGTLLFVPLCILKPWLRLIEAFTMAPSLEEPIVSSNPAPIVVPTKGVAGGNKFGYVPGRTHVEEHTSYEYDDLLPSFPNIHWEPLEEIYHEDRGIHGDPKFRNLLQDASNVFDYNPKIGTEIHGLDLANLTDAQRDDLARLVAYRGVVFFRDQKNLDVDAQRNLGKHFGRLHKVSHILLGFKKPKY